jgi:hypothetical protein
MRNAPGRQSISWAPYVLSVLRIVASADEKEKRNALDNSGNSSRALATWICAQSWRRVSSSDSVLSSPAFLSRETFLEHGHQINDLAFIAFGCFDFDHVFVSRSLLLDELQELLGLLIFEFLER